MAVPIPPAKEFLRPDASNSDYAEGAEVSVPPGKIYTLQLSENTGDPNDPTVTKKGWYICKEGRSGIAISGVTFTGEEPILVSEFPQPGTSLERVDTQIRISDVDNVGD